MIEKHLEEMNDLADIMFAMDQNFQDRENEAKSEYQSMRDEIKNKVCASLLAKTDKKLAWSHHSHSFQGQMLKMYLFDNWLTALSAWCQYKIFDRWFRE